MLTMSKLKDIRSARGGDQLPDAMTVLVLEGKLESRLLEAIAGEVKNKFFVEVDAPSSSALENVFELGLTSTLRGVNNPERPSFVVVIYDFINIRNDLGILFKARGRAVCISNHPREVLARTRPAGGGEVRGDHA